MAHPVTWFQIQGDDSQALQDFYKNVFGWRMNPAPDGSGMAMVQGEKGGIQGGIGKSMTGGPSVSVYIDTGKLEEQLAAIEKAGGKTAMQPMDLPPGMGRIAGFIDPGGNWIGLWDSGQQAKAPRARAAAKRTAKKGARKAAKPAAKKGAAKKAPAKKAPAKKAPAKKAARKK
jgi:predicted enzyme related to lactoylglutathione lyase